MKRDDSINVQSARTRTCRALAFVRKRLLFIVLVLSALCVQKTFGRQVEFASEEIELTVADSVCTVQGSYWFKNKNPKSAEVVLFYPFVINERLPYPDTVVVVEGGSNRQVGFTETKSGIYFRVTVHAFGTALYRVSYVQRTAAQSMEYLLRTTAQWKKPLEYALYRVRVPEKYVLISSTMLFSRMYEQNGERIYETCEENFMPSKDFIIQWQRREQ